MAWQLATHKGDAETWIRLSPPIDDADEWRPLFAHPAPAQTPMSEEYARKNPFGGPAARLIACANMIMAGDDYYASLREFGLAEEQTPMTTDQLHAMATDDEVFTFEESVRAVERHHGIGGKE